MDRLVLSLLIALGLSGCQYRMNVNSRTDFKLLDEGTVLTVYTVNGTLYKFDTYSVTDSMLIASGRRKQEAGWVEDSVHLPWSSIAYIQGVTSGAFQPLIAATAVGLFVASASSQMSPGGGLAVTEDIARTGGKVDGNPYCPFVYSWDGGRYRLEGGALGTALGKAMEGATVLGLPSLKADSNVLRIRVTNERPETHYLDFVQVYAVEPGPGEDVVFDDSGSAWPVKERLAPCVVVARDGTDLKEILCARDQRCWDPGTSTSSAIGSVEFAVVDTTRSRMGSLLISCNNTPAIEGLFLAMCDFLGDAYWDFLFGLEHDPQMRMTMDRWFEKNGLHIEVRDGNRWAEAACFIQRGNALPYERLARIQLPERAGDTLWFRIRMRSDLWRVDAVAFDPSGTRPLERQRLPLASARTSRGESATATLSAPDSVRMLLLPPEYVDLSFVAPPNSGAKRYGVEVRGYLYIWKMKLPNSPFALLRRWIPNSWRLEIVKFALSRRGFLLRSNPEDASG